MPQENDKDGYLYDEIVPGTHVTSDFLTEETSNMYDMACPAYREVKNRLSEMGLKTHRQNLANYADKGYEILKLVLPALKDRALAPGSHVNVDETWERFQTHFGHRKTYMWCLVNRKGSLFFGSVQGALRSAMYNTFIQTCKQVGVSFRQYFKALLKAVKSGRTDYENLLPMTICLN